MGIIKAIRDKSIEDKYMCKSLLGMFSRGDLRKDHPQQRNPGQWTSETMYGFIATIIKAEDVDSIKICEQIIGENVILWLIDGIQRLTTIERFRKNIFCLGRNIEFPIVSFQEVAKNKKGEFEKDECGNLIYNIVEYDLRGKFYRDLPEKLKDEFDNFPVDVVKHLDCTDEEIGYHIRRYNRQTSMNASQKTITYMDSIAKYVKDISEHRFFIDSGNYSDTDINKNVIDRVISESVMSMFHLDNWKRGKSMGTYLNRQSSKEEFDTYKKQLARLHRIVKKETTGKLFNSKNSFIWFSLFNRFVKLGIDDKRFSDFLSEFQNSLSECEFEKYKGHSFRSYDKEKSTKDKIVIITKLDMLETLMTRFLESDLKQNNELITDEVEEYITEFGDSDAVSIFGLDNECGTDIKKAALDILKLYREVNDICDTGDPTEDIELYTSILSDWTLDIDNNIKMICKENLPSLVSLVGYACNKEMDELSQKWFVHFARKNGNTFLSDQKRNYLHMKEKLDIYIRQCEQATA